MGQEQTKILINNQTQNLPHNSIVTTARKTICIEPRKLERIQCEGLLKLRATPFKNSVEIQTETEILFLQNVQTTMKQLLEARLNTNKLFIVEDIEKMIEEVTYTLAFLQQNNITYKDVSAEHIYYDQGSFKILPNQLIDTTTYQRLKQQQEVCPSPELIIALRCGEEEVSDDEIVEKSNVFTLGMILLEVATLLPSLDCYDVQNYDILDGVINERLILVEEYYGSKISRIIANMLDYDYTERMGFKQLSIWINRQLQQSRNIQTHSQPNMMSSIVGSKVEKNLEVKIPQLTPTTPTQSQFVVQKPRNKLTKNNSVYMGYNREAEPPKQDKNKIYIHESSHSEEMQAQARGYHVGPAPNYQRKRNQVDNPQREFRDFQKQHPPNNVSFNQSQSFKINEFVKHQLRHPNPYCEDFRFPAKREDTQKNNVERETTKRITKEGVNPYKYQQQNKIQSKSKQPLAFEYSRKDKIPLRQVSNQFYPNIEDIVKNKNSHSSSEVRGPVGENGAMNRIKEQIQKSRKLIEQFKKSQGLKL